MRISIKRWELLLTTVNKIIKSELDKGNKSIYWNELSNNVQADLIANKERKIKNFLQLRAAVQEVESLGLIKRSNNLRVEEYIFTAA